MTPILRTFSIVACLALAAVLSCQPVCGCLSPPAEAILRGRVQNAAGAPDLDAAVNLHVANDSTCLLPPPRFSGAVVMSSGAFREVLQSPNYSDGLHCVSVQAYRLVGGVLRDTSPSAAVLLMFRFAPPADSATVVLRIP